MALGGFAPLPLRLGGQSLEGITAAQWSRMVADVVAMTRSMPLARLAASIEVTGAGVLMPITFYAGQHGTGQDDRPTPLRLGVGHARFTWATGYADDYDKQAAWTIRHARASCVSATEGKATAIIVSANVVEVYRWGGGVAEDGPICLTVG